MKYVFVWAVLTMLLVGGCTQEHKLVHKLECVVSSDHYVKSGKTVNFKREDAIRNGYVYHLSVYDDGTVVVGDSVVKNTDTYLQDDENDRSYSLQKTNGVDREVKFQFTKAYDDVKFLLLKRGEEFHYDCKQIVNKN